jgi:hypothetical protein
VGSSAPADRRTRRGGLLPALTVVVLVVSGCSDSGSSDSSDSSGDSGATSAGPTATTVDLTLDGQPVDLAGATLKCYDYQGHVMVEAHDPADSAATHFLLDSHGNNVTLSIGVQGGLSGVYEFAQGQAGQTATVTRDGDSVSATGTIDDTTPPKPFSITARCAKFFDTPPDSSKVDSSELPSIPASCPPGEAVCLPGG